MDAAQRQAARGLLDMAAQRYIPPELRGLLGLVAEANPVVSMDRAGTAAQGLLGRQATPMQRVGYAGDMLSNMAGVVAPAMVASRAGLPAAQALQESVMGFSQAAGIPEFIADESGALRLYHGSPHDFDRFSMDKIGTGEGAQAYGHGLYFAESEGVAKSYRDALSSGIDGTGMAVRIDGSPISAPTVDQVRAARFGPEKTAEGLRRQIEAAQRKLATASDVDELGIGISDRDMIQMDIDGLARRLEEVQGLAGRVEMGPAGRMYEVEVNANPEDFLDWDAPLSAQPQKVREAWVSSGLPTHREDKWFGPMQRSNPSVATHWTNNGSWVRESADGGFEYGVGGYPPKADAAGKAASLDEAMSAVPRSSPELHGSELGIGRARGEIESALREAGIPGIRYLDAGSRGAGDGSRNYVVFDENLISIVRKYGIAGAAALYGVSQADIAQAMNPTTDRQTGLLMAQTPPRAD